MSSPLTWRDSDASTQAFFPSWALDRPDFDTPPLDSFSPEWHEAPPRSASLALGANSFEVLVLHDGSPMGRRARGNFGMSWIGDFQ